MSGTAEVSRVERKKRDTRERIIDQAERLMGEMPVDEVTISSITAAADVGHGTFYLHFKSKYEVLVPIIRRRAEWWDEKVLSAAVNRGDPAALLAFAARHMSRIALRDPLWRCFLQHSGVPVKDMQDAVGRFGARDLKRGLEQGRFNVPSLHNASVFVFGGWVNSLLAAMDLAEPDSALDDAVEMMLRALGLPSEEARKLAHSPLLQI